MVVYMGIKLLQNQQVYIPKPDYKECDYDEEDKFDECECDKCMPEKY
jgi:hypothetical protein